MIHAIIEDLSKKHPKGASLKEVNEFCDTCSFLPKGSKLREEVIVQISHYGE